MTLDRDDFEAIRVIVRDEVSRAVTRALRSLHSSKAGTSTTDAPITQHRPEEEWGEPGALGDFDAQRAALRLLAKVRRARLNARPAPKPRRR